MPVYQFQSPCGAILSTSRSMSDDTLHKTCDCCGLEARRIFSDFGFHRFVTHVSPATGTEISSDRQFRDELKRASEDASRRTGIDHNFQPVDLREVQPKNMDGLEATHRKHRELGLTQRKASYF